MIGSQISNWTQFERQVRRSGAPLLAELDRFPDALLIAGCQHSGTAAVTRLLRSAGAMPTFNLTRDDELDAALILSGRLEYSTDERACFQTTYLNDHVHEYFDHCGFRLVWIIRPPEPVVRSMLYNWKRGALNRLFRTCGSTLLNEEQTRRYKRFGNLAFDRLTKACLSYNAKNMQIQILAERIPPHRLKVIEYESLVTNQRGRLADLLAFCGVANGAPPEHELHTRGLRKPNGFSMKQRARIAALCDPLFQRAQRYLAVRRHDN